MKTFPKVIADCLLLLSLVVLLPGSAAAQATLSVVPTSVNVTTNAGTNAASQTVQVRKSGAGALRWSVTPPDVGWLTVSPTSGTNNASVILTFQTSGLAAQAQPYPASFRVVSGTQSVTVNVALTVVASAPPPALTVTCPANQTATSTNGSSAIVTYPAATTTGGAQPVMIAYSNPSGSSFPVGTTTVNVTATASDGKTATCSFLVTVSSSAPATLTITCPGNQTATSPDGFPVAVSYPAATTTGGTQPVNISYSAASGSNFPVGTTTVQVTASSNDGQTAGCSFTVTVTSSAPSPLWTFCGWEDSFCAFTGTRQVRYGSNNTYFYKTLTGGTPCTNAVFGDPVPGAAKHCDYSAPVTTTTTIGPTPSITCPAGAIDIFPGTSIQTVVNNYGNNTTFCLRSGTHWFTSPVTPKTGDTFIGEYGAIVDGTGWATNNDADGAFRAYNQDIDYVTIRNLVIRNLRRGIHAGWPSYQSDHWTIENNEIGPNYSGIQFPAYSTVRNNYIHNNSYSGYIGTFAHSSLLENNEISFNGWEQKVSLSDNVTFRGNFVHHNNGAGIWFDSDNRYAVIEGNRVEDNGWIGIFYEISDAATINNNAMRRNGEAGVMLGTSKNTNIFNNVLENNLRGITFYLNCGSVGPGSVINYDLTNNNAYDNTVTANLSGEWATNFSVNSNCTSTFVAPYKNGSMNLKFTHNSYDVPSPTTGQYWYWDGFNTWSQWQTLGQDTTGTAF
jgi:parallel beta-helix repeat protein